MNSKIQEIVQFYQKWYRHTAVPAMRQGSQFASLVNSPSLVSLVYPDGLKKHRVIVGDFESGATDGKQVYMPLWYFSPSTFQSLCTVPQDMSFLALAPLNGTLIHEFLHIRESRTPKGTVNLQDMAETSTRCAAHYNNNPGLVGTLVNVAEDIFIEQTEAGKITHKMLYYKNCFLLPEEDFNQLFQVFAKGTATADDYINAFVYLKNFDVQKSPLWKTTEDTKLFHAIAMQARNSSLKLHQRAEVAADVYEFLAERFSLDNVSATSSETMGIPSKSDGESVEGAEGFSVWKQVKASFASGANTTEHESLKHIVELLKSGTGSSPIELVRMVTFTLQQAENGNHLYPVPDKNLQAVARVAPMKKIREIFRYMDRTKRPDLPKAQGPVLLTKKLASHSYDERLFSTRTQTHPVDPCFIVLVDGSGSMDGTSSRNADNLKIEAMAVAERLHDELRPVPHLFAVHSTGFDKGGVAGIITKIAGTRMGYETQGKNPFGKAVNMRAGGNFDGLAIEELAKNFKGQQGKKYFIVISDGEPSGNGGYSGETGIKHTREVVEKLRKQGVIVISISLTYSAVRSNNEIYGAQFNINATQGNLAKELEKIVVAAL